MLRYFNRQLHGLDGKPFMADSDTKLSLGRLVIDTLLVHSEGLTGVQKYERYKLCTRIDKSMKDDEPLEMTVEEIAQIKEAIAARQPPMVVGPVWDALERE